MDVFRAITSLAVKRNVAMRYMVLTCVSVIALMAAAYAEKAPASLGVLTCTLVKLGQDAAHKMSSGFKPAGSRADKKYGGEANSAVALQFETNNGGTADETITRMELQLTGTPA
jgi:hypothetical protein